MVTYIHSKEQGEVNSIIHFNRATHSKFKRVFLVDTFEYLLTAVRPTERSISRFWNVVCVCPECDALSGKENLMFCKDDEGIELCDMSLHASESSLPYVCFVERLRNSERLITSTRGFSGSKSC